MDEDKLKKLYVKQQYYPLGWFCEDIGCNTRSIFDFNYERDNMENIEIQRKICEKECNGCKFHYWMRNPPKAP